jgi:hypothetical protein
VVQLLAAGAAEDAADKVMPPTSKSKGGWQIGMHRWWQGGIGSNSVVVSVLWYWAQEASHCCDSGILGEASGLQLMLRQQLACGCMKGKKLLNA